MIGKVLKHLRNKKNLKQEDLASLLNIDQTTLSGYETERRQADFETIEKIANECGYDIYFVSKNDNDRFQSKDLMRKD